MDKIRILVIAPYSGMKTQFLQLSQEFDGVELVALDGDLQNGVAAAKNHFHSDFDVIISRGGTAALLRSQVELPVVEVQISAFDILRAIRLAEQISTRFAVVGFPNIVSAFRDLSDLSQARPAIFTTHRADEVDATMDRIYREGYSTVICDVASAASAKSHRLNAVLISSGPKSIRQAIGEALRVVSESRHLRDENIFLKELIYHHSNDTVIFDADQNLYFSTMETEEGSELLNLLRSEIPSCQREAPVRIVKCVSGNLYTIKAQRLPFGSLSYYVFSLSRTKAPFLSGRSGIRYFSLQKLQQEYVNSLLASSLELWGKSDELAVIAQGDHPVMIVGEEGCGRQAAAKALYLSSKGTSHPFLEINCSLLNEKTWGFLEESHHSPFADAENTIYISEVDSLSEADFQHLVAVLLDMEVCRRNQVYLSCLAGEKGAMSHNGHYLSDKLGCLPLLLPPLREGPEKISALINLYISQHSITEGNEILGMAEEGIRQMAAFAWPHNLGQFKRVMSELCIKSQGQWISRELVQKTLEREAGTLLVDNDDDAEKHFDIHRSLQEIEADIIKRVLKECMGNQSLAAKRLGISRTTLWRACQNIEG